MDPLHAMRVRGQSSPEENVAPSESRGTRQCGTIPELFPLKAPIDRQDTAHDERLSHCQMCPRQCTLRGIAKARGLRAFGHWDPRHLLASRSVSRIQV